MKAKLNRSVAVLGTGSYLPDQVITQEKLHGRLTNYDEERSGDFARRLGGSGIAALPAPAPIASEAEAVNQRNQRLSATLDEVHRDARGEEQGA